MASLSTLLAAYHLTTGDVIHVSAGTYNLSTNVVITADDSGVTIQGPSTGGAILNRGDTGAAKYAVELNNADHVTLEHLALTGGYAGIYAGNDSDHLHVTLNQVYGNAQYGIYIDSTSDLAQLTGNTVYGQSYYGICAIGPDTHGQREHGVQQPDVASMRTGAGSWAHPITVSANQVYSNTSKGIYADNARAGQREHGVRPDWLGGR